MWRPADALETAVAWQQAVARRSGPTALILSRQSLPFLERGVSCKGEIQRGGYCLIDSDEEIVACVIATGSEVQLAVSAQQQLSARGIHIRVVSMPNAGLFLKQSADYQQEILPAHLPRVAIEAGAKSSAAGADSPNRSIPITRPCKPTKRYQKSVDPASIATRGKCAGRISC